MIIRKFPDLSWIKQQANSKFDQQRSPSGNKLPQKGWPSVLLNTKSHEAYRSHIRGPISLFLNLNGISRCGVNGRTVQIHEEQFFLTNQDEYYTLEIESHKPVETFNIHFGEKFAENLYTTLVTKADLLLEESDSIYIHRPITFQSKLYPKTRYFNYLVLSIYESHKEYFQPLLFDEQLTDLLTYLLLLHRKDLAKLQTLPIKKKSTQIAVNKQLNFAVDYIYSCFNELITLDDLAQVAGLSKHHFLRLFKLMYGLTPHQFINTVRINTACRLLKNSRLSVQDIALAVGFDYPNSFSRLFKKKVGIYPNAYRNAL